MRAWVEVNLGALERNLQKVRQEVGSGVEIMAVVKADAYGLGIDKVTETADSYVDSYAVISVEEARSVRRWSTKPVLVMSYLDTKELTDAIAEGYMISIYDRELIAIVERFAARIGVRAQVQLKVDTGLSRLGLSLGEAEDFLSNVHHFPNLELKGVFSHLYKSADETASSAQLQAIQSLMATVSGRAPLVPLHLASSYSLGKFRQGYLDGVRIGLAMYGIDEVLPDLEPVMSCKAVIMQVKNIPAGQGVSYGHLFVSEQPMTVAIAPIGYAEGLSQALTGKLTVLVQGQERPVLGQVAMNHIIFDVTNLDVRRGEEVVLIGKQKSPTGTVAEIKVAEVAKKSNIRHHEIVTRLGRGLPRIYTRD